MSFKDLPAALLERFLEAGFCAHRAGRASTLPFWVSPEAPLSLGGGTIRSCFKRLRTRRCQGAASNSSAASTAFKAVLKVCWNLWPIS